MKVEPYWVIEHPSRGVYVGNRRFRYSILRSEGIHYSTLESAQKALTHLGIKGTYVIRMTSNLKRGYRE